MFRSRRRPVVFAQADHARLAGTLALAWRERPPVPFQPFVRGVAAHARGYGEHDADDIDTVESERWVEIQRRGFAPRGEAALVDLVVALHVRRLLSSQADEHERAAYAEVDALLPSLLDAAGVDAEAAAAADRITQFCDRIAFAFCFEDADEGDLHGIRYALDGLGAIELDPWPLGVLRLTGLVTGFEEGGYPSRLVPVVTPFEARPACQLAQSSA